ncbi:2Fe-2S iron-sulfur cluster-binding protein [Thermodesulfobacteriota bacterium]
MSTITLTIDGIKVEAAEGERILQVALRKDIYIPNLCAIEDLDPPFGACRLCFVEVEGIEKPVASCTVEAIDGMRVRTRSEAVDRLVKSAFELIMSDHDLDCKNCVANKACELQRIAKERRLSLKPKRLKPLDRERPLDESHPCIVVNPNRCVLCGRCVHMCGRATEAVSLDFAFRGINTVITTQMGAPADIRDCDDCRQCIEVCPVGALQPKEGGSRR